jgi:tape measure domain-containing protein
LADVRSLTTVLDFAVENAGLKEYQREVKSTLSSIKNQVQTISRLFGAAIAIDVGKNFIMGLSGAIRSANKLSIQLAQILTPGEDVKAVTDDLFRIAQAIGEEYGVIGNRFKAMAATAKEVGVSTETTLAALENISKATEVNRLSGEETEQVFSRINMAMRRGVLSVRTFGELLQEAPVVVRTLGQALGKTEAQLRELAKAGKLTSEVVLKAFARNNPLLQGEWEAKADTLGEAFNYAYNWIIRIGQALWKGTKGVRYIAMAVRWLTDVIVAFGRRSVAAVGGLDNAIRLLQITFATIFSYYTIGMVLSLTKAIIGLGTAGALASLKFLAIAAAIAAIVLAIEDIYVWTQGGESVTGDLIGSFEDLGKTFEKLAQPFLSLKTLFDEIKTAIDSFFTGNWATGFTQLQNTFAGGNWFEGLKTAFDDVGTGMFTLITTAGLVKLAFVAWNGISFVTGLIASLFKVTGATTAVEVAAGTAKTAFGALNTVNLGGLISLLAPAGPLLLAIAGVAAAVLIVIDHWDELKQAGIDAINQIESAANRVKQVLTNFWEGVPTNVPRPGEVPQYPTQPEFTPGGAWAPIPLPVPAVPIPQYPTQPEFTPGGAWAPPAAAIPPVPPLFPTTAAAPAQDKRSWWQRNAPSFMGGQEAVAPGAIAPVQNNEQTINNSVPITNNVNVSANIDIGSLESRITDIVAQESARANENIARQLTRAAPAMEARTG